MNCQQIQDSAGYRCVPISESLLFVEAPFCLAFDGMRIAAYLEDIGRERIRISDNADILWSAMTHGVTPSAKRANRLRGIAEMHGLSISQGGEIYTSCEAKDVSYFVARFVEAAAEISYFCRGEKPAATSEFERMVGQGLVERFKKRVKRNYEVVGASGHQLTFPFVIDAGKPNAVFLQTIASPDGRPNWKTVYHTLGKMTDLSNLTEASRVVVLERGDSGEMQKVAAALGPAASVLIYENSLQLAELAA